MPFPFRTLVLAGTLICISQMFGGIVASVVTPENLKNRALPFSFSIATTPTGSVEVSVTLEPSVPYGGDPSCSLQISSLPIPKQGDLTLKELTKFVTSSALKKTTEIAVLPNRKLATPKMLFLSRRDADFAVLYVYYPRETKMGEAYYVPISRFLEKPANKAPEPTPGSVTPRATESVSK